MYNLQKNQSFRTSDESWIAISGESKYSRSYVFVSNPFPISVATTELLATERTYICDQVQIEDEKWNEVELAFYKPSRG